MSQKDIIEIPFGAKDSELVGFEYTIPEGYKAEIKDGKVIVRKAENEDEKIRKWIINYLNNRILNSAIIDEKKNCLNAISWLEKQGEHANFRNKIQIGDKVTRNEDGVLVNLSQLNRVAKKDEKQGENNMGISEATKQKLEDNLHKALEKETPESCNEFLDEQGEQKPAWSEEDETRLNNICRLLVGLPLYQFWLKSLRPRKQWKPSDRELAAMLTAIADERQKGSDVAKELLNIYQKLKKLKG